MKKLFYIRGNNIRGKEVIDTLKKLGGINNHNLNGTGEDLIYFLDKNLNIQMFCPHIYNLLWKVVRDFGIELLLKSKKV